jgi:chromosome partitioning protein
MDWGNCVTKIYAFVNQKGGLGQRVLMVDLDPQANATSCLGVDKRTVKNGTYEVLIGSIPPAAATLRNEQLGLSLIPSTQNLTGAEVELINEERRETRLRDALQEILPEYDYILIDSPPSLGIITLNALVAAANGAIIPVQCEYLALEGLSQLTQTIGRVRASFQPHLEIRGVVMTMFDGRTNLGNQVIDEVRRHFPGRVFASVIPRSIRLAEAPSHGIPISVYAPSSIGALAYQELAEEILKSDGARIHAKE